MRHWYQTLEGQRQQAHANLRHLQESAADAGPDGALEITRIKSMINEADRDLANLKKRGDTLERVRRQLGALTERYKTAAASTLPNARLH